MRCCSRRRARAFIALDSRLLTILAGVACLLFKAFQLLQSVWLVGVEDWTRIRAEFEIYYRLFSWNLPSATAQAGERHEKYRQGPKKGSILTAVALQTNLRA